MNNTVTHRQQEIINTSLKLIAEKGIQSLTIKNLSKRIGFAESAIYRHYENKTHILLAILNFFEQNSTQLFEVEINSDKDALLRIENLFKNHFKKFEEFPSLVAVIFAEEIFRNEKSLTQKVANIINKNSIGLEKIIKSGQVAGTIRSDISVSNLAIIIMGSLRMFVKQWHLSNYDFNLTVEGNSFIVSIKTLIKV